MTKTMFLDTFALRTISCDVKLAQSVRRYMQLNDYVLILTTLNFVEIYPKPSIWTPIIEFIASVPFCICSHYNKILAAEIDAYPDIVDLPIGFYSYHYQWTQDERKAAIESQMRAKISGFSLEWHSEKQEVWQSIIKNKRTFPPENNGKYSEFQKSLFLQKNVLMFVSDENRDFITQLRNSHQAIKIEAFKSVYILTLAIFLEYYVQKKTGENSDIGDFLYLCYAPYVDLLVLDKERNSLLQRISNMGTPLGRMQSCSLRQFTELL